MGENEILAEYNAELAIAENEQAINPGSVNDARTLAMLRLLLKKEVLK